jgi:hypothetical protein
MRICPRNAAVYGHQLTEQQSEEWCQRVKGQQCNGIKCRWNSKEVAIVKVKRDAENAEQLSLFSR